MGNGDVHACCFARALPSVAPHRDGAVTTRQSALPAHHHSVATLAGTSRTRALFVPPPGRCTTPSCRHPPPPPPHITPSSPVKAVLSYPDALPPTSPPPTLPLSSAVCSPLLPSGCSSTTPVLPPLLTTSPTSHNTQRTPRLRHAAPPHLCCFPPPFAFGGVSRLRGTPRLCLRLFRRAGTGCDAKLRTSLAHGETHSTFFLSTPAGLVFCASPFRAATSSMAAALTTTRPSSSRPPAI